MNSLYLAVAGCAAIAGSAAAAAPADDAFTGPYAGLEAGSLEHHYFLETRNGAIILNRGYRRAWGVGGGVFAGYTVAVSRRLRVDGEVGLILGGASNPTVFADGTSLVLKPRYGYRLTLRGGGLLFPRLFAYAIGGYGGQRYRLTNSAGVIGIEDKGSSFVVGAGVEYRLSRRAGLRFNYRHLDNQTHEFFVGLPVRF
jgi:outer membrane immunogenic protein